jgi:hypothetical protein
MSQVRDESTFAPWREPQHLSSSVCETDEQHDTAVAGDFGPQRQTEGDAASRIASKRCRIGERCIMFKSSYRSDRVRQCRSVPDMGFVFNCCDEQPKRQRSPSNLYFGCIFAMAERPAARTGRCESFAPLKA